MTIMREMGYINLEPADMFALRPRAWYGLDPHCPQLPVILNGYGQPEDRLTRVSMRR